MTGMFIEQRDAAIARRFATFPAPSPVEAAAAAIGRQDAARPGARLRLILSRHPRALTWARILFGFRTENGLADDRLEAIRAEAFSRALLSGRGLS
ncbi:MAG: hypothetical protein ACO1NM_01350 [Sphingobium phenoxybenzoativorans]